MMRLRRETIEGERYTGKRGGEVVSASPAAREEYMPSPANHTCSRLEAGQRPSPAAASG